MIQRRLRQLCLGSALGLATAGLAVGENLLPEPRGVTARNLYFEVWAEDMLSAQYVATVGELFAGRFSRMLPVPTGLVRPVFVTLAPVKAGEAAVPFSTTIHPTGQVNVTLGWGAETTREGVERALVQGYLTYLSGAYSHGGVTVPLWLELAGLHLTRIQAVPAHGQHLGERVSSVGPMRLDRILAAERAEEIDERLGAHAYWLLVFLEREGRTRGQLQHFLIRILRGEPPLRALQATYGQHLRSSAEAQLWWLVGVNEVIGGTGSPLSSAKDSKARVGVLSRFSFETEAGWVRLFPEDLWDYRASASLQDELRHRIALVRMGMGSAHPFYRNVFLSLERLFEAVLAADPERYREALLAVRHDWRTGDELTEDTDAILNDLEDELSARKMSGGA